MFKSFKPFFVVRILTNVHVLSFDFDSIWFIVFWAILGQIWNSFYTKNFL